MKNFFLFKFYEHSTKLKTVIFLFLVGNTWLSFAQCPIVAQPYQKIYSQIQGVPADLIELDATDQGGGLAWYATNSSTTILSTSEILVDNTTYFAGSIDGSCVGNRAGVTVELINTPEIPVTDGIMAYFPLDGNGDDISGNNYRGAMRNTNAVANRHGQPGKALNFNGSDSRILYPDILDMQGDYSVNAWFKLNTSSSGHFVIAAKSFAHPYFNRYAYGILSNSVGAWIQYEPEVYSIGTTTLPASEWHMFTAIYDRDGTMDVYLDGVLETSSDISNSDGVDMNSTYEFRIGEYLNRYWPFNGDLDDISVYGKVLSQIEIDQLYTNVVLSASLQDVTTGGNTTDNLLLLNGGLSVNNEQLLLAGNTMNNSYPLEVAGQEDANSVKLVDGGISQSNTQNVLEGIYDYNGAGALYLLNKNPRSELKVQSADTSGRQLVSLQLDDKVMTIGSRDVQAYYSVRQELDSLPGNLDLVFEDNEVIPLSFRSDTTMVSTGQLQLGDSTATGYDLVVGGAMISESMVMKLKSDWPDYVFSPDYKLPSLASIKAYIEEHNHLPGMPSAKEVVSKGLNIPETNRMLLKKVEELTLHLFNLHKDIKAIEHQHKK